MFSLISFDVRGGAKWKQEVWRPGVRGRMLITYTGYEGKTMGDGFNVSQWSMGDECTFDLLGWERKKTKSKLARIKSYWEREKIRDLPNTTSTSSLEKQKTKHDNYNNYIWSILWDFKTKTFIMESTGTTITTGREKCLRSMFYRAYKLTV